MENAQEPADWSAIARLVEAVAADTEVVDRAVAEVQQTVTPVGELDPDDVARHSRMLLAAAMQAIVERRGPTREELGFIAELAVTRARQGVAIESVLAGIHVAQRHIWRRARQLASQHDVGPEQVLDASDLYDEWAQQVTAKLIVEHRRSELERAQSARDRRVAVLRRLLDGEPGATSAARSVGLDPDARYLVLRTRVHTEEEAAPLEDQLAGTSGGLFGRVGDELVGLLPRVGPGADREDRTVAVAGPVGLAALPVAYAHAGRARAVAEEQGRNGRVTVAEVAFPMAARAEPELARVLVDAWLGELDPDDEFSAVMVETAVAHLGCGQRVTDTAATLFVHANTVRYRLDRFRQATGRWPETMVDTVHLFWAATAWLERRRGTTTTAAR